MLPSSKTIPVLVLSAWLAGCAAPMALPGRTSLSREVVEADLRSKTFGSQISSLTLELRSVRWVDEHMPGRFGSSFSLAPSTRKPERLVWVALVEGRLSPLIWSPDGLCQLVIGKPSHLEIPSTFPAEAQPFAKVLVLIDPDTGHVISLLGKIDP